METLKIVIFGHFDAIFLKLDVITKFERICIQWVKIRVENDYLHLCYKKYVKFCRTVLSIEVIYKKMEL